MFGGDEVALTYRSAGTNTSVPASAHAGDSGELKRLSNGPIFKQGARSSNTVGDGVSLSDWWITGSGDIISLDVSVDQTQKAIKYKKRSYSFGGSHTYSQVLDANVHAGRIWAVLKDVNDNIRLFTATLGSAYLTQIHQFDAPVPARLPLVPAFDKTCSTLVVGWRRNDGSFDADVKTLSLNTDGTVSSITDSVWVSGYNQGQGNYVPVPFTTKPPNQGFEVPTNVAYPIRGNFNVYPVGTKTHFNADSPYYAVCIQQGTTGGSFPNFFPLLPEFGGQPYIQDGSARWAYGGDNDPDTQPSGELINVDPAWVSGEYTLGWRLHGIEAFTLEQMIDELWTDSDIVNVEVLNKSEFAGSYNRTLFSMDTPTAPGWVGTFFGFSPLERKADVRATYQPPGQGTSSVVYHLNTVRFAFRVTYGRLNYSGPLVYSNAAGWYTGSKPAGWVRHAVTGVVDQLTYMCDDLPTVTNSVSGEAGGATATLTSVVYNAPGSVMSPFIAAMPAAQGYSLNVNISESGIYSESLYIGGIKQYSRHAIQSSYLSSNKTYSGTVGPPEALPLPTNVYGTWRNYTNPQTSVTGGGTFTESIGEIIAGNLQARVFYVCEHYHAVALSIESTPNNSAVINRKRHLFHNGVLIHSDDYQAATNAYKIVPTPSSMDYGYRGIAPIGGKTNRRFIASVYDIQGNTDNPPGTTPPKYWGGVASVNPGQYAFIVDSDGVLITEVPFNEGAVTIDVGQNNDIDPLCVHLNILHK